MKQFSLWSGLITLLLGLYLFVNPFTTTAMIGWLIALFVFLSGTTSLMTYFATDINNRRPWQLIQGIISVAFGFILLTSSAMSLSNTVITIAAYWFLISGIFRLMAGMQMRKAGFTDSRFYLGSSIGALAAGLFLLFNPTLSAIFIGRLAGLLLMTAGISSLLTYWRMP